jgi:hypothetical protein
MKWMVVDQFLMSGKVIGFDGEILLVKRLRAGRGAEIGTIGLSLLLSGKPAQPIFRHPGRGIPKCQLNRAPLVDAEGAVCNLKPAREM